MGKPPDFMHIPASSGVVCDLSSCPDPAGLLFIIALFLESWPVCPLFPSGVASRRGKNRVVITFSFADAAGCFGGTVGPMFLGGLFLLTRLSLIGNSLSDSDTLASFICFTFLTCAVTLSSLETGIWKCRGFGGGGEDDSVSCEVFLTLEVASGAAGVGRMGTSVNSSVGGGYTMYLSCCLVLPFSCNGFDE